ncbi:Pol Polyprotein [Phytophthora megakarya]|uniref:Pol Polyprotein n=1 Tax=Phytophthora megakarya TaxID=4795 RepID=A0A225V8B8_9STRA|nr:Pol Polyprotein [Phytophthora megakarya]
MDAPLTANDFYGAIMHSKNGKAPGPDGLPIEYYKVAPNEWARIYEVVHDSQLSNGQMTKFQRRAHLSLLYKSGDRTLPGNYRPLTLLNHDAKLAPKILAHRMGFVLPEIIHEDQSGFIPGRSIRHSLLRFQDLQDLCKAHNPDACAVLLDFAKAFDSVLWPALDLVLHHFGFGATFRNWVKTFYYQTSVSIMLNNSPGEPFLLGAGVRQGDPLSPGLFVVFVEPMMNFLRARFAHQGIKVDEISQPHLLMAFADDCTGLLSNISDATTFLELVQDYATAAGLRLNVQKTCIMPFTHRVSPTKIRDLRASSTFKVLGTSSTVKLLGVLQGASITADIRFSQVLLALRARCAIWKYRARTLRGKVVILRSILLPLLWYTASVTCFTASMLRSVDVIIRNFVNAKDTNSDTAAPGKFDKNWIYTSVSQGGLGLTPAKQFIQAMHLKSLKDAITATCRLAAAPRWIEPALSLFTQELGMHGDGFDILYADIKGKWVIVPDFWRATLRLWNDLHHSFGTTDWKQHADMAPFWNNFHLLFGKTQRPLTKLSQQNVLLQAHGVCRQRDFVDYYGSYATHELLCTILDDDDFARPASKTRFINQFIPRINLLLDNNPKIYYGPFVSRHIEAARHDWELDGKLVTDMENKDFVKLVLKARKNPKIPDLPLAQLGIADISPPDNMWNNEYGWDRYVLPVAADVKFRLQHNALGFRYKFQWRTLVDTSSTCIHGCDAAESAKHLFWLCHVARFQWDFYLQPLHELIHGTFKWEHILFPGLIQVRPTATRTYGANVFHIVFNIIRCCVIRSLWLHRNKKLYNEGITTNATFVKHHCFAYVDLHLRKLKTDTVKSKLIKLEKFVTWILEWLKMETTEGYSPTILLNSTSSALRPRVLESSQEI